MGLGVCLQRRHALAAVAGLSACCLAVDKPRMLLLQPAIPCAKHSEEKFRTLQPKPPKPWMPAAAINLWLMKEPGSPQQSPTLKSSRHLLGV